MILRFIRIFFIFLFTLCAINNVFSQKEKLKVFSDNSKDFFQDLKLFMSTSSNSEHKDIVVAFEKKYNKDLISKDNFNDIRKVFDLMLQHRKRPNTHFKYFIQALNSFIDSESFKGELINWLKIIDHLTVNSTSSRLIKFLGFSEMFFQNKYLQNSRSLIWQVDYASFNFVLDSVPLVYFGASNNLYCYAKGDTISVLKTKGFYSPITNIWYGDKGIVNWSRVGLDENQVYVELSDYKIKTRMSGFSADSIKFFRKDIFPEKYLLGVFSDKLVNKRADGDEYPKFKSYNNKVVIKDIIPDIDFVGVYALEGAKFVSSSDNIPATLIFFKNDKKIVSASSNNISINNDLIISNSATVNIYLNKDSIVNSNVMLKYFVTQNKFNLISSFNNSQIPYYNSYHEIDMYFDVLTWNTDDNIMYFGSLPQNKKSAIFTSSNYFSESSFHSLGGIDRVHPLLKLSQFIKEHKLDNEFSTDYFISNFDLPYDQALKFINRLNNLGFVIIDYKTNSIIVKDKLFEYLDAYSKKIDFDNIKFSSRNAKSNINAELDLGSMDLKIFGVDYIPVSQIRKVFVRPKSDFVILKKNRDFSFTGSVYAGLGEKCKIHGKNIFFHYHDFKFSFIKADSLSMKVPSSPLLLDARGLPVLEKLVIPIQKFSGELLIDDLNNKSGNLVKDFGQFPILRGYEESQVYYDDPKIYKGVYKRDIFYFNLDPFEIDSLDNFTRESLSFTGILHSADIFEPFREKLVPQDDNSLGFETSTPEEGLVIYNQGEYFNKIFLNSKGLTGTGMLNYNNVTSVSDEFVFFPDSMTANVNSLVVNQIPKYDYPLITANNVLEHLDVKNDIIKISSKQGDISLYDSLATFKGSLFLLKNQVFANGVLSMDKFDISSNKFDILKYNIKSDTADFVLKTSSGLGEMAFESVNLKTNIDLLNRLGTFKSNGEKSFVIFKENQFISYIDVLNWFIDKDLISLGPLNKENNNADFTGSEFISIHPEQDSLSFIARSAEYNLSDYIIYAHGVDSISLANGYMYPDNGDVKIMQDAKIARFNNSRIFFNEYYINNCDLDVLGKFNFSGQGFYEFVNNQDTVFELFVDKIYIENDKIAASATSENDIILSDKFKFRGDMKMLSGKKDILYSGILKIYSACNIISDKSIYIDQHLNMDTLYIVLDDKITDNNADSYVGLYFDNNNLYFGFFDSLDDDVYKVLEYKGILYYTDSNFVVKNDVNSFSLNENSCIVRGLGLFDFGFDFGLCNSFVAGKFEFDINKNKFFTNCMLGLDFNLDKKKSFEILGTTIQDDLMLEEIELEESFYLPLFSFFLQEDQVYDYDIYGEFKYVPDQINKSLFFYDVQLRWDNSSNVFYSVGDLGLGNIKQYQINKNLKGGILLDKTNNSFDILLESEYESYEYYFFNYKHKNKTLSVFSENMDFMNQILDTKKSKREEKKKKKLIYFYDVFDSEEDKEIFKNKLNKL